MTTSEIIAEIKAVQYTESHSLEESLAKLEKYKERMSDELYASVTKTVWGFAIEDMFCNEKDFEASIAIKAGRYTGKEYIAALKEMWRQEYEAKKAAENG